MSLAPGQTLSHYRLIEKIGEGGMGVVWKATDIHLDRDVAVKILPEALAGDRERLLRFEREAKLLASLDHPNIATVHGLLEDRGVRFLAMELVRGEDLAIRIGRGALSLEDTVTVGRQIASALEAAHEHGVVHRDLKPANVIVGSGGQLKVLDFGLAKSLEAGSDPGDPSASPTLTTPATLAGAILGTASYMSPEQARGQAVDRRADIWAFGCVLFECLTGRRVFAGDTVSDTLAAVLRAEPEWDALPARTPPALGRLLRRCLDRDPRTRLRDIGEARVVLEGPLDAPAPPPAVVAGARSRWTFAVVALVLAAMSALVAWTLRTPPPLPLRKFAERMPSYTDGPWDLAPPVLSPDGRWLAFVRDRSLWIRELSSIDARKLPNSEGVGAAFWSPDSRWIAWAEGLHLWKAEVRGAAPVMIARLTGRMGPAGGGAWMPDGNLLVSTGGSGILSVSSQGGDPVVVLEPGERESDFHDPSALPDGRGILFLVHGERGADSIAAFDGRERRTVFELRGQWLRDPVYAPSGHVLFQRATGLWALPFSLERLEAAGEAFLLVSGGGAPSVARDGTLTYLEGPASPLRQLTILDREGETIRTVGEPLDGLAEPAWSPDGRRIAVAGGSEEQSDIWIYDAETGARNRLTFSITAEHDPRWFSDGARVAFLCDQPRRICVQRSDGSGEIERIEVHAGEAFDIAPGGRWLVYDTAGRGTRMDLRVRDLDEGSDEAFLATPDFETRPRVSPDGRLLAHIGWELGQEEVYLREFPVRAGRWQVSSAGGSEPRWSDREIFWLEGASAVLSARTARSTPEVTLGPVDSLFRNGAFAWGYDVSADGRQVVLALPAGDDEEFSLVVVQNWFAEFANR